MQRSTVVRPVAAITVALLIAGCASHKAAPAADLTSDVTTIDAAFTRALALLDLVQLPAGAVAVKGVPAGLTKPDNIPTNGLPAAGEPKYWTVPGTPADVIDYVRSNPPAGLLPQPDNAPAELEFASKDKEGCACNVLQVRVVAEGDHSAVRADAEAIWHGP